MKKLLLSAILLLFIATFFLQKPVMAAQSETGYSAHQLEWIKEEWTGDEKPYQQIRVSIDKAVRVGAKPQELADRFRKDAKDWSDPVAQYHWAYPAYLAEKQKDFPESSRQMYNLRIALATAGLEHPPRNYEYSHLRFLAEAQSDPNSLWAPMAERLVQRNPKDYAVRFLWAKVNPASSSSERKKARDNVQVLLKAFPKDPRVHMMIAGSYYVDIGPKFRNQKAIDRTIAAYRKVQSFSKPGDKYYQSAQFYIEHIQKMQKWWVEHPNGRVKR